MAAGTILYAVLAVLASFIREDLAMSRAQFGWIVTAYAAVSAASAPVIGRITDWVGARAAMLAIFTFSGIGFLLLAAANAYPALIFAVLVIGVGQTLANPATNKMIAHEASGRRRGLITGIKQSGVQAGTFVGGVTFPALAVAIGWRGVPLLLSFVSALALLIGWWVLPRHPRERHLRRDAAAAPIPPSTWWIAGYAFLMGAGGSPVFSFLPLYAIEEVGVSEAVAGLVVGVSALLGVGARIVWSVGADRRGEYAWPMVVISAIAVAAGLATIAAEPLGVIVLWVSALLGYLSISAWNSVAMLSIIVEAGPRASGRASGIVMLGFMAGLAISPPFFGWSVDRYGTYRPGYTVVTVLFGLALITMLGWIRRRSRTSTVADSV